MKMTRRGAVVAAALTCCVATLASAQSAPSYKISATAPLGAPDRWDYVVFDKASGQVFVAHGDRLSVVNGRTGAVVGEIPGFPGGTHGIAISVPNGRGYTDDGRAGVVKSFDLKTLKVEKTIPAQTDADGITLDPLTGHVFVVDGDSGKITVIDPVSDTAITTIDGGAQLEYAVADNVGKVYVNGAANNEILRVDARTNAIDARWPVPDCTSPHGLAIDPKRHRLFSSCVNSRLVVLNTDTGAEIAALPIGRGTDAAAFDPVRQRVFSSNGIDGTLTVIQQGDQDDYKVIDTVKTAVSGRTLGIDPVTGRLYIAVASIDPDSPPGGRPKWLPGSLKLIFLDPVR